MPYCHSPWTNLDIDPQGKMSPCCKFEYSQYDGDPPNIITSNIQEYNSSKILQKVKADFAANQWPAGCIRCKIEEDNQIKSKRQLDFDRWQEHYDVYTEDQKIITASIAFGNTCNLKCIMCGPRSSSKWYQEARDINDDEVKANHFYKENFVDDFIASSPNLIHLDIPGGEPFLSGVKQQKQLLQQYIETDQSNNMTLHYTTNAQIFPDNDWWNLWKYFKQVDIQLSVDGIKDQYEYIRFPGVWTLFEQNCLQYIDKEHANKNIMLSVSHTLSAYNVYYLDEFFSWCASVGLPRPWVGRVHNPNHLRVSVFPDTIKKKIVEHLKNSLFGDVRTWANHLQATDDSKYFSDFCSRTQAHDLYRGLEFDKTFPELSALVKKI